MVIDSKCEMHRNLLRSTCYFEKWLNLDTWLCFSCAVFIDVKCEDQSVRLFNM